MITIDESGVTFGPFEDKQLFAIENCNTVKNSNGIKVCEFVWFNEDAKRLYFIEAKSSCPNSNSSLEKYQQYFTDIYEKLENAVTLVAFGALGKHQQMNGELPANFKPLPWQQLDFRLLLVIPEVPSKYLPALTDSLRKKFVRQCKIWGISPASVYVINRQLAQQEGLLVESI